MQPREKLLPYASDLESGHAAPIEAGTEHELLDGADIGLHVGNTDHVRDLANAAANAAIPVGHEGLEGRSSIETTALAPLAYMLLLSQVINALRTEAGSDNPIPQLDQGTLANMQTLAQSAGRGHERI